MIEIDWQSLWLDEMQVKRIESVGWWRPLNVVDIWAASKWRVVEMSKTYIFWLFFLMSWVGDAGAGGYKVSNYLGNIGHFPVHVSMQFYDSRSSVDIYGSYFYDNHRWVLLYGQYHRDGRLELCEIPGGDSIDDIPKGSLSVHKQPASCPFSLALKKMVRRDCGVMAGPRMWCL